jgi:predicted transcriptional regulator
LVLISFSTNLTFASFSFEKTKERFDGFLQKLKEGFLNTGNFGKGFSNLIEVFQKLRSSLSDLTSETFEVSGNLDEFAANWTDRIRNVYDQSADISLMNTYSNLLEKFSISATQALVDLREYRTKMVFVPEDGKLLFEQVLPFPWHTLKEGPNILVSFLL